MVRVATSPGLCGATTSRESVGRVVPGNFMVMTDRDDLGDQNWRTFIGHGVTDDKMPRAGSGKELRKILFGDHGLVFSSIIQSASTDPYGQRDCRSYIRAEGEHYFPPSLAPQPACRLFYQRRLLATARPEPDLR